MERSDWNEAPALQAVAMPETVFIFDMQGEVHEVVCRRDAPESGRNAGGPDEQMDRQPGTASAAGLPPRVIRRWLAGFVVGFLGLGLLAEPGFAGEGAAAPFVQG